MLSYIWVRFLRFTKNEIETMVIAYQNTNDKAYLNMIAESTIKIIYKFGKSYKNVPKEELNYIFGIALNKAVTKWNPRGQASFTTYLSTIIINELKRYLRDCVRQKQKNFENSTLQELDEFGFDKMLKASDDLSILIYEDIVNETLNRFEKDETKKALLMYLEGHKIESIVKTLNIGRTNFYYNLKQFKAYLREELESA